MKFKFLFRLFLPFALGYFISYCFRSVNAIIVIPLREEFFFYQFPNRSNDINVFFSVCFDANSAWKVIR